MNTEFEYLYRDQNSFKKWGTVIFAGAPTDELKERLEASLDDAGTFIAHQVRVPEVFIWASDETGVTDNDHVWHEFYQATPTEQAPTDPRTFTEFVEAVERADAEGWMDYWLPGEDRPKAT